MKKLMSFILTLSMLACLFVPISALPDPIYTDWMHQAYETEADIEKLVCSQCTVFYNPGGVFGSQGAATAWDNTDPKLAEVFGDHFLNAKAYLASEQALADAGINPTETDIAYIAKGQIPKSLYCNDTDEAHLSDVGYTLLAQQVYNKMVDPKGWSSVASALFARLVEK